MDNNTIDTRVITSDWLMDNILFRPFLCRGKINQYETTKRKYLEFRNKLNQDRARSGQPAWTDYDIREFIDSQKGAFNIYPMFNPGE